MSFDSVRNGKPGLHEVLGAHFFEAHRESLPTELTERHVQWVFVAVEAARCSVSRRVARAPLRYAWQRLLVAGFPAHLRDALMQVGVHDALSRMPFLGGRSGDFRIDTQQVVTECRAMHLTAARVRADDRKSSPLEERPFARCGAPRDGSFSEVQPDTSGWPALRTGADSQGDQYVQRHRASATAAVLAARFFDDNRSFLRAGLRQEHVEVVFRTADAAHQSRSARVTSSPVEHAWNRLLDAGFPIQYMLSLRRAGIDLSLNQMPRIQAATGNFMRDTEYLAELCRRLRTSSSWMLQADIPPHHSDHAAHAAPNSPLLSWMKVVDFKAHASQSHSAQARPDRAAYWSIVDYREKHPLPARQRTARKAVGCSWIDWGKPSKVQLRPDASQRQSDSEPLAAPSFRNSDRVFKRANPIFAISSGAEPSNARSKTASETEFGRVLQQLWSYQQPVLIGISGVGKTLSFSKLERLRRAVDEAAKDKCDGEDDADAELVTQP